MATPAQAAFYPAPSATTYQNADQYVIALHEVLRAQVAQLGIPGGIPPINARTNRFRVASLPGIQFTIATSPVEAAASFRRIRDVYNYQQAFDAWMAGVSNLSVGTPASSSTTTPPSLSDTRFDSVQAELTIHFIERGQQQTLLYDTDTVELSPEALRLLTTLGPQQARDDVWIGLLGRSIYWGQDGIVVGVSLRSVNSVNYKNRSLNTDNFEVRRGRNRVRAALRPRQREPTTRRTRSQGPPERTTSQIASTPSQTRSGQRFTRGSGSANAIQVVRPNRRDFNYMNYRPQNSDAPVPCSKLLPPMSLEDFRKNVMDSTEIYRSSYMKSMAREEKNNMCWFSAVCDLVNSAADAEIINFECLLNHINYTRWSQNLCAHTMQSIRNQGLSLQDMIPIFDHFKREVRVFNVADDLIYYQKGTEKRFKRIKPYHWVFIMAHNHVYPVHDFDGRTHHEFQVKRQGDAAFGNNMALTRDEFLDTASPMSYMFPYHLRLPSRDLRLTSEDTPEAQKLVHILYRDTSLFELLMKPRFEHKDRSVVVLVDRKDSLENIYLEMVRDFKHRPDAFFIRGHMIQISSTNHGHYQGLMIKRMGYLNNKNHPDMITTTDQYLLFEKKAMEFRRILFRTDHLSFLNSSTFELFEKFTRTPKIGPMPGINQKLIKSANAVDFNRLYSYALQTLDEVPVLFPHSKFRLVPPSLRKRFPTHCFVIGKVHGKRTAYLHQEYSLVYYPHLLAHIDHAPRRAICFEYNPVFCYNNQTTFEILLYCEVTQLVPLNDSISKYMRAFWNQPQIPKSAKKLMFNTSIGMLGTKRNDLKAFYKGVIVDSPDEMSLLGENYNTDNFHVTALDDSNYVILPTIQKCVNRYQSGMVFYQTIVDAAVLHVSYFVDQFAEMGVPVIQIQTDELYFPSEHLLCVCDNFVKDIDHNQFEANGLLKLSKETAEVVSIPDVPGNDAELEQLVKALLEVQRFQPAFADYEMLPLEADLQSLSNNRVLLTASVPGAGKTHRIATQDGITGVIAVPTNALAVDLQTKFPQHNVVTIHRLLSKVGRAFGLMDSFDRKEFRTQEEEEEDQNSIPTKIFRDEDSFLCIDEIYMLPTQVLLALYHFLHFLPKTITHVYATGDPYQLDPVEDRRITINSSKSREAMIIRMFPKRIKLARCRRMHTEELNRRVEKFCAFLRTNRGLQRPNLRVQALTSVCHEHNVRIIHQYQEVIQIMKEQPDMLIAAYTNETCHKITKHVLGSLENKLTPGVRLINRRRFYVKGGHRMHLNYIYEVQDVNPDLNMVRLSEIRVSDMEDEDDHSFWLDADHVLKHMHWHRTRTAHCLQGTSWDGGVIVCDVDRKHLVNRAFFYVTMTRARDFARLFVYIPQHS